MNMTYIFGYNPPEEIDVDLIRANRNGCLDLSCTDGISREAEFITYEDGKIYANLSENS